LKLVFRKLFYISSLTILGGCSWLTGEDGIFDDTEYDYTNAQITSELQVPKSVGELDIQDHFLVPEVADDVKGVVYGVDNDTMAPMQILTLGNKIRVNRNAGKSSVYVTESEIRLWDLVERYLAKENVPISAKDLNTGTISTGWRVKEDDSFWSGDITGWRHRFKITLDPAQRPSEKILSVEIVEAQEFVDDTKKWRTFLDTGRDETELLNSILGFMYVEDISKSRERVSQSELGGLTVSLGSDSNGNPALITTASFEHVWTRIPVSLRLLNIIVDDQDRSQGLFFIRNNEDDKGFFASLAFWSDDGESLDLPKDNYRIQVARQGEQISMTFFDDNNTPLEAEVLADNYPLLSKAFRSRAVD